MKPKQILTAVLLLFVAVSLIAVVIRERGSGSSSADKEGILQGDKTVVYFFHGNKRCKTCNNMEQYTRQSLRDNFGQQLADGSVELRLVNLDESKNAHFADDYGMDVRVVVLSRILDGKEVGWKKLERVWELSGDESAYREYIASSLSDMLRGEN